ncbi:MAG: hypothetical protein ABSG68_13010 [Thermoguttaceae bacterium]|jgi:hypothetical protein
MSWKRYALICWAASLLAPWAGCGSNPPPARKPAAQAEDAAGTAEISKNLAQLSESDRKLAEKQKICPVSGELLGSMDKPVKVVVKGRTVFLCCDGCKAELEADPDKFLAKLDGKK